jgi:hypothetical protein
MIASLVDVLTFLRKKGAKVGALCSSVTEIHRNTRWIDRNLSARCHPATLFYTTGEKPCQKSNSESNARHIRSIFVEDSIHPPLYQTISIPAAW